MISQFILVGAGGFLGAICRVLLANFFSKINFFFFPLGTFIVNISGAFALGFITGSEILPYTFSLLFGTGFLGAYTTFSTLQYEAFILRKNGRVLIMILYLILTYVIGIGAAWIGFSLGEMIQG